MERWKLKAIFMKFGLKNSVLNGLIIRREIRGEKVAPLIIFVLEIFLFLEDKVGEKKTRIKFLVSIKKKYV